MLMLEHLDHLSETAAKAISEREVRQGHRVGQRPGRGRQRAANFLRGLGSSLPPMLQIMKDIGGVEMPEYFGKLMGDEKSKTITPGGDGKVKSEKPEAANGEAAPESETASIADNED